MERIQLTCECCNKVWDLSKTNEIPAHIFFMRCNFCIECDFNGKMTDYYEEWWNEDDNDPSGPNFNPVPDNQLCLPFIFDEIGIPHVKEQLA